MRTGRMKRGFTLIETVVTVGIVAAMAAVVIPQVAKQFDAADPTRFQNDMKNLQTAIETFSVNVKELPGDLDDLTNTPGVVAGEDSTITNATTAPVFTSTAGLWNGPYIDLAIVDASDTDETFTTGYNATVLDSFVCFDSGNQERGVSQGSSAGTGDPTCQNAQVGQRFLAVQITGILCQPGVAGSVFMELNELFDGTTEAGNADVLGRIRCRSAGGTRISDVPVVYFLAVGIS